LGSTCATNEHSPEKKKPTASLLGDYQTGRHGIGIARAGLEKGYAKSNGTSASTKED
jgi:hypothetical protein